MIWIVAGIVVGLVFLGWIALIVASSKEHEENQNIDDRMKHFVGR